MIGFEVFRRHVFLLSAAATLFVVGSPPGFAQVEQRQEATPPNVPAAAGEQPKQQSPPPKRSAEQQAMLREAERLNVQVVEFFNAGRADETLPLATKALRIREQILGKEHPRYATSLHNLASLYHHMGEYAKAEPLFLEAMQRRVSLANRILPTLSEARAMAFAE